MFCPFLLKVFLHTWTICYFFIREVDKVALNGVIPYVFRSCFLQISRAYTSHTHYRGLWRGKANALVPCESLAIPVLLHRGTFLAWKIQSCRVVGNKSVRNKYQQPLCMSASIILLIIGFLKHVEQCGFSIIMQHGTKREREKEWGKTNNTDRGQNWRLELYCNETKQIFWIKRLTK